MRQCGTFGLLMDLLLEAAELKNEQGNDDNDHHAETKPTELQGSSTSEYYETHFQGNKFLHTDILSSGMALAIFMQIYW